MPEKMAAVRSWLTQVDKARDGQEWAHAMLNRPSYRQFLLEAQARISPGFRTSARDAFWMKELLVAGLLRNVADAANDGEVAFHFGALAMLKVASVYYWTDEMFDAAQSSGELPECIITERTMPEPFMCMFADHDLSVVQTDREHGDFPLLAIVVSEALFPDNYRAGLTTCLVGVSPRTDRVVCQATRIGEFGARPVAENAGVVNLVLKMLAFLKSPCIVTENTHAPRYDRKAARKSGVDLSSLIVVTLRKPSRKTMTTQQPPIEWSHRWLVSGHFRNQWFPACQEHHPVWIGPYVKGPAEKPFVVKQRLMKVVR